VAWRYLAQRALTGEWIDLDVGLSNVEVEDVPSGPGGITATIAPADSRLVGPDGRLLFEEWSTILYAEKSGSIRGAGLLQHSGFDEEDQTWKLEAPGFTSYLAGQPFEDSISEFEADPFDLVRRIWASIQSRPDGDLGVVVDEHECPVTTGDPDPGSKPTEVTNFAWNVLEAGDETTAGTGKPPHPGQSPTKGAQPVKLSGESVGSFDARVAAWEAAWVEKVAVFQSKKDAYDGYTAALSELRSSWSSKKKEWEPYELSWWESPDCGAEIDTLAKETPFEYRMEHNWVGDSLEVEHRLRLAYPRFGTRRHDLRFVVGENVAVIPQLIRDGDGYANHIVGLGKGEGKKMLRAEVGARDGRLRRVKVMAAKDVGSLARLRSLSDDEHRKSKHLGQFEEIVVLDHPNAPMGSWTVGDEILVVVDEGNIHEEMWCRIVTGRYKPDEEDTMTLVLVRAERGV